MFLNEGEGERELCHKFRNLGRSTPATSTVQLCVTGKMTSDSDILNVRIWSGALLINYFHQTSNFIHSAVLENKPAHIKLFPKITWLRSCNPLPFFSLFFVSFVCFPYSIPI